MYHLLFISIVCQSLKIWGAWSKAAPSDLPKSWGARALQTFGTCLSHCSRVARYNSFISQDLFHFPMLIPDGDTLNSPLNLKINGRILKNSNFFTYWKIFSEIYVLIHKTVAILIKLGINIVRICKESQHWSKNLWIKPD